MESANILGELIFEFFLGIIFWVCAEIIFYRLCYSTGVTLIILVSLGKYYPGKLIHNRKLRKIQRTEGNQFTYVKDEKKYISYDGASMIGLVFWTVVILILLFTFVF